MTLAAVLALLLARPPLGLGLALRALLALAALLAVAAGALPLALALLPACREALLRALLLAAVLPL